MTDKQELLKKLVQHMDEYRMKTIGDSNPGQISFDDGVCIGMIDQYLDGYGPLVVKMALRLKRRRIWPFYCVAGFTYFYGHRSGNIKTKFATEVHNYCKAIFEAGDGKDSLPRGRGLFNPPPVIG